MSAFDALLSNTPVKSSTAKSAFDVLISDTPKQVNKFGTNVSGHAYNPLNPNNIIDQPQVQEGFWKRFTSSVIPAIKTVAKEFPGAVKDTFSAPIEIVKSYIKPSETEQKIEKQAFENSIPGLKQAGIAVLRTIVPLVEGYGTTVGDILGQREEAKRVANAKPVVVGKQVQPEVSTLITHQLTAEEVLNVALNSIQTGVLIAPFVTGLVKPGAIRVADAISKNSKVDISLADVKKITTSSSDAEAISRVGQQKYAAYKEAAQTNSVRQAIRDGYIELSTKEPNTFANILRNAATRPITEIRNFARPYGQPAYVPSVGVLPERVSFREAQEITPSILAKYEPKVEAGVVDYVLKPTAKAEVSTTFNKPRIKPSEPLAPTIESEAQIPSKIAQSIERKVIEQKLTEGFQNLAGYDRITIADQAERAARVMAEPGQALQMITGERPLPEGLRGTALITAAEEYIKKTGDARMAYELANSPLVSETSAAAQEMRLAAEREPDSLALKLQEIRNAREQSAKKKYGGQARDKVKAEIRKEVSKSTPKAKDWASFIDELRCT